MDNNITSKNPEVVENAPFKCPHCDMPANGIRCSMLGALAVMWHVGCKKIISCQLIPLPQQVQSRIHIPN